MQSDRKEAPRTDPYCCDIERDSQKDEAVVFIFIIATGSLLAWAVFKPWIERYLEVRKGVTSWRRQRLTRGDCRQRASADHTYPLRNLNTERRILCIETGNDNPTQTSKPRRLYASKSRNDEMMLTPYLTTVTAKSVR